MDSLQKAYRNLLISITLIGLYVAILFLLFYPSKSGIGYDFGVAIMYMLTRYVALGAGIGVIIARLVRVMKSNNGIVYVIVGTLNVLIGVLCVILYSIGDANMPWLNKCLCNLLIGIFISVDVFLWRSIINPDQTE